MKKTVANRRMFRQGGAVNSGPTGILASSPSLIDAVAQDAMNVQGGPTVRMADGGIVRMANGGPVFPLVPTRTPQIASDAFGVRFDPTTARRARNERGLIPANKLVFEELGDTGRRIFPRELEPGQADIEKVRRGQPVSNLERAAFSALGGLRAMGQDAAQYLQATGGKLMEKEIAGQPGALPDVSITQREAILDMTKMYPEIKGFIENEASLAIKANPELSPEELKGTVARALEAPERRGAEDAFLQGISRFGPQEDEVMTDMTDADPEYVGDVPLDPGQDDTLDEEDERTDPTGEVQRAEAQGQDDDASFLAGITPPRKPDVEDPNIAGGTQNEIEALGTPADAKEAQEQVAKTFDKQGMKPEEAKRGMEYYLDQFKGAVPEYEGMSESEKGMIIAEAGLRVMAGQSPHAIENIAKGLQGVSKEFIADKKARRAYNRQIGLSAAKYALEAVSKDLALEEQDKRTLSYYYDVSKKDKDNPYGKLVAVSRAEILANNGQLPANLKTETLVKSEIAATAKAGATLKKALIDGAKEYKIGRVEAKEISAEIDQSIKNLESSEAGIGLLAGVKAKLAAGDVTGFKNAAQELVRRGFAAIGKGDALDQKYSSYAQAQADVKQAFQALIPVSLGGVQSANSISNRDVQFLADAFIDSGFLNGGMFNMAFVDDRALASRLDGAIEKFRAGEKEAIASIQSIETRLSGSEVNLQAAQAAGLPVGRGPFNRGYFAPRLKRAAPLVQRAQTASAGRKESGRAIAKIEGFTWDGSKYVVEGTN